eukprot:TCONS_00028921-protein
MADIEEEDGSEVFEIDDFTVASEWERFIKRIEEVIGPNGWNLDSKDDVADTKRPATEWISNSQQLKFHGVDFVIVHHKKAMAKDNNQKNLVKHQQKENEELPKAILESVEFEMDFCPRSYPLSRWYGLKEFVILSSLNDTTDTESKINVLLSSISIALSNCKCQIPMFIQVGNIDRRLYFGACLGNGYRTSYEMIHLKYTPHQCNHVQGMINVFQEKLGVPLSSNVTISIRFAFSIRDWSEDKSCDLVDENVDGDEPIFDRMPFGALEDPVRELQVAAIWPCVSSEMLVDDETSTQLDALHAPVWKLKARGREFARTALSKSLKSALTLSQQRCNSTKQIIRSLSFTDCQQGRNQGGLSGNVTHALDRLTTNNTLNTSNLVQQQQQQSASPTSTPTHPTFNKPHSTNKRLIAKTNFIDAPLSSELLDLLLVYLFPDAGLAKEEAIELQERLDAEQRSLEQENIRNKDQFRHIKSAPANSLTYKLALCVACVNDEFEGLQAVAHLWHEFVLEMRYRFENNIKIPCLAQCPPHLNYTLIHQKLQMLNCCIDKSQQREQHIQGDGGGGGGVSRESETSFASCHSVSYKEFHQPKQETPPKSNTKDSSWNSLLSNLEPTASIANKDDAVSSDDVIENTSQNFVTDDESEDEFFEAQEEMTSESMEVEEDATPQTPKSEENKTPEGVSKETDMKLLCCGKPLCIPITQEAPPLTEDMLLEQQDILTQLGTSEEGTRMRIQMQCASLLSDMESFKAANPGCILADFVRWYSPNDWLPGPQTEDERTELNKVIKSKQKSENQETSEGWEFELDDEMDNLLTSETQSWAQEGRLSLRMRVPGNTWQEVWNQAKIVPARRQKRLFDDTKEAEKILHFFDNLSPSEVMLHLMPIILQASIERIQEEEGDSNDQVSGLLEDAIKSTSRLQSASLENFKDIENAVKKIYEAELLLLRMRSLRKKLYNNNTTNPQQHTKNEDWQPDEELESFINQLLSNPEVPIKGGPVGRIGKSVKHLLHHQKGVDLVNSQRNQNQRQQEQTLHRLPPPNSNQITGLPKPIGREYILRTSVARPSKFSRASPQRLFVVIMPEEFRMAGSFTQDTTFI